MQFGWHEIVVESGCWCRRSLIVSMASSLDLFIMDLMPVSFFLSADDDPIGVSFDLIYSYGAKFVYPMSG